MKRLSALVLTLFLLLPQVALASTAPGTEEEFNPEHDFDPGEWVPIHLGSLDLSINKTVAYLMLGSVITMALGITLMRVRIGPKNEVGRRQAVGEIVYDVAQTQVAEQGLPHKAIGRWFPYVASLMLFIWVVNMIGFIPLPLSNEKFTVPGTGVELPTLAIYAATSSISVTLTLALMTWVFTHIEGIRHNGPVKYFKSWIPDVPKALYPLIVPLEILGQFMRLISLSRPSLREHARRPHADPDLHRPDLRAREPRRRRRRSSCGRGVLSLRGRDRRLDPGVHLRRTLCHLHRLGHRARALKGGQLFNLLAQEAASNVDAGKAIALALGIGLGSLGAGIGIGNIFGSMIQAVARQPELRGELTGIQWLGFALTEAVVFYGLIGGLLAYVLV